MEFLNKIKSFFSNNKYDNISFFIDDFEFSIFVDFDPNDTEKEDAKYKITWDRFLEEGYLDTNYMIKHFTNVDCGLDIKELSAICDIIKFLNANSEYIESTLFGLHVNHRNIEEKKENYSSL